MEYQIVFTKLKQQSSPLSAELMRGARPLLSQIEQARDLSELTPFLPECLTETLSAVRRESPKLGGLRSADVRNEGWRKDAASGKPVDTWKHHVALEVFGDIHLLAHWPDAGSDDLTPVDASLPAIYPSTQQRFIYGEKESEGLDHFPEWTVGIFTEDPSLGWALFTHVFLTPSDERDVATKAIDLNHLFVTRRQAIEPLVARVAAQTDHFFDVDLPELVRFRTSKKRLELENRAAVTNSLHFLDGWRLPAPELTMTAEVAPGVPDVAVDLPDASVVSFDPRPRLSEATFADVQRTIRVWADAVERYPKSFAALHEDRLSDLLAATLNATLPAAEREVYTRNGKSDIFIHADVLSAGAGPARVFICESKWARSKRVVENALDPQLFGYMNANDTAAVLLLLLPTQNRARAIQTYLAVLRGIGGYLDEGVGTVQGWPILRYEREGRSVQICIAFIHLPRQNPDTITLDNFGQVLE